MIQSGKILGVYYSTSGSNSESNDLQSNMNHLNNHLNPASIEPWFITGFTDGEGCFIISISRSNKYSSGWTVKPSFKITLHQKDLVLLQQIKNFFGVGSIYKQGLLSNQYCVTSVEYLAVVINHFEKYPLNTKKWVDYLLFKKAIRLIQQKKHLTKQGLRKIVAIRASMNLGLSDDLKTAFPKITPVSRSGVLYYNLKDPHWCRRIYHCWGLFFC